MKSRRSPGVFRRGAEALEIHAVGDHRARHAHHLRVFLRHHHHARELPQGTGFEAAPAKDVPRGGKRALAARDLREQVEGDVMLHQDVAAVLRAVLRELRVLHL